MAKLTPYLGEVLNESGLRSLVEHNFPQIPIERTHLIESGWESKVLVINDEYVFRFPRWMEVIPKLRREVKLLPMLRGRLNIRIPDSDFISAGAMDPTLEEAVFVGYRMLPGELLTPELFQERVQGQKTVFERCAAQIGGFLTALHRFPREKAIDLGYEVAKPSSFMPFLLEIKAKAEPLLTHLALKRVDTFISRALELWDASEFQVVMTHGDLAPEHLLFNPESGQVSGVIDFGDALIDDPAGDFTTFLCQYSEDFTLAVLDHYEPGLDDLAIERCDVYRRLEPFYWISYGLDAEKPAHVKAGVTMLEMDAYDLVGFRPDSPTS